MDFLSRMIVHSSPLHVHKYKNTMGIQGNVINSSPSSSSHITERQKKKEKDLKTGSLMEKMGKVTLRQIITISTN